MLTLFLRNIVRLHLVKLDMDNLPFSDLSCKFWSFGIWTLYQNMLALFSWPRLESVQLCIYMHNKCSGLSKSSPLLWYCLYAVSKDFLLHSTEPSLHNLFFINTTFASSFALWKCKSSLRFLLCFIGRAVLKYNLLVCCWYGLVLWPVQAAQRASGVLVLCCLSAPPAPRWSWEGRLWS